jgi:hypothetical protein
MYIRFYISRWDTHSLVHHVIVGWKKLKCVVKKIIITNQRRIRELLERKMWDKGQT